ncbi:hypothetical protein AGDE_10615 [Angomonas deanei]|nr:hypothetical protein AGDE_10615 [Angomonas deanei]|eukprot:EPY27972.1 hypothetical protein AGDE_10615 [Angomonas deanei]
MAKSSLDADELGFDIHYPTETPLQHAMAASGKNSNLEIPPEYMRRVDAAQRTFSGHYLQYKSYQDARSHALFTLGMQGTWMIFGSWLIWRGYRYEDPINSLFTRWTTNQRVRLLTTPVSFLGVVMVVFTATQLPFDLKLWNEAVTLSAEEEIKMTMALRERQLAFNEGREVIEAMQKKEKSAFLENMEKTKK